MPKIALIGAGSLGFGKRLIVDILSFPELADSTFSLMDINKKTLAVTKATADRIVKQMKAPARIESTTNRRKALDGADYVISMFRAGDMEVEKAEVLPPLEKHGLRQTVADTVSYGAVCRSLRTVPVMLGTAHDMEELCPDAWWLNYTNPMAINCWAVFKATKAKIVGLCHSVQGTSQQLANYIGAPYGEINFKTAGINHMAWVLKFEHKGKDAYPRLFKAMENPEIFKKDTVRFTIMKHFGYFVTESTRHMAEYTPYFLQHDEIVAAFNLAPLGPERYPNWKKSRDDRARQELKAAKGKADLPINRSHEYGAYIIHSLFTGMERCIYGSVENTGLITNLPRGCAVEVPCLVNKNGIQGCYVGEIPPQCAALNRTNINVQDLTVRAILERNREYIYHACMLDPNTAAVCTLDEIRALLDERLKKHRNYMPLVR
ncbi:MAG: alpha-glucosidase/alpha-galactosidase [Planctomycetota bacterium]